MHCSLFCKDTTTTEIYTTRHARSLHGALPSCATLIAPARVTGLTRTGGALTVALGGGTTIAACRIIDAGGRRSRLLRSFGQRRVAMDRLACAYQRVPQCGAADPSTYTQATPEGWWYTAAPPAGWRIVPFHGASDQEIARASGRARVWQD